MSGRVVVALSVALATAAFSSIPARAQSDPLDPANPAQERIWLGGRLLAVDRVNDAPSADSVAPSSGSGASQVFTLTYSDRNGFADIKHALVIINASLSGTNACYAYYNGNTGNMYLKNDANTVWLGPLSTTLENSQCRLSSSGSSASGSETELTVQFNLTFLSGFSGSRSVWGFARDQADLDSGWQALGSWSIPDGDPDSFTFTDQSNVQANTLTNSNIVQISGINTAVGVTISGTGSPQYRTCSTSNCSSVIQNWTSGSGSISNNQYLQLRLTSGPVASSRSASVVVGGGGDTWAVDSEGTDNTPNAFSFTDQTNVAVSTLINSNIKQITGINVPVTVTISGSGSPQYRTCSTSNCSSVIQNWTSSSGSISNNQYLQLRLTSASTGNTLRSATVNVGTGSDGWNVTTLTDNTPNGFNYSDQTNVALATLVNSNVLQITGINVAATVTISGITGPQYRTCSTSNCSSVIQNWTSASGSISNNQYLQLRMTSSAIANTVLSATVTVGTGSDVWYTTTRPSGSITLTTTGSWTVPAGVTQVSVTATGGGGGGGGGGFFATTGEGDLDSGFDPSCGPWVQHYMAGTFGGGGGGGGSGAASGPTSLSVTPGAGIGYTIGAGGAAGTASAGGSAGGTTTFQSVSGSGGTGGGAGASGGSGGYGGSGGTTGGTTGNGAEMCMVWQVQTYYCGVVDSGTTCTGYQTGNAAGGGSGFGAGGTGGAGEYFVNESYFEGATGGSAGSAGRIVITWP